MKEYHVAYATASSENEVNAYTRAIDDLELQITHLLEQGWELQGGVTATTAIYEYDDCHFTRVTVYQAITKSKEEKNEWKDESCDLI